MHAGLLGAVYAAIKRARLFDAMADDAAVTMRAMRGQPMDRTFEAVERVSFAVHHNLEALVVVVSAVRTNAHSTTLHSHSAKEARNKSGGVYFHSGRPSPAKSYRGPLRALRKPLAVDRDVHISGPGYANRLRHQRGRRPWYRTRSR